MNLVDAMLIGGFCLALAAIAYLVREIWKAPRRAGGRDVRATEDQPGGPLDLFLALVWTGMLLMQGSNILLHVQTGAIHNLSPLTWYTTAGNIFICGLFAGRLLLRREMRQYKKKREEQEREARA